MTDEQIIDDFRRCLDSLCTICPNMNCTDAILNLTFDLINRKTRQLEEAKAEIERLEVENYTLKNKIEIRDNLVEQLGNDVNIKYNTIYTMSEKLRNSKSEAIKEFAKRLKEIIYTHENRVDVDGIVLLTRIDNSIDNLVKEMTKEKE